MRVPRHHLGGLVPGNGLHGHDGDRLLAEPAGALVAQVVEGQAHDSGFLQNFIVAGPHAVIGVLPGPDVLTAAPVPVAAVKPLPHTRIVARYALRRSSCPAGTLGVRSSSRAAIP